MPKLGTKYNKDSYFKEYYRKNKDKYKSMSKYFYKIKLDNKEYIFNTKQTILDLIEKIEKN